MFYKLREGGIEKRRRKGRNQGGRKGHNILGHECAQQYVGKYQSCMVYTHRAVAAEGESGGESTPVDDPPRCQHGHACLPGLLVPHHTPCTIEIYIHF